MTRWQQYGGWEPPVADLIADPIFDSVLRRDGIGVHDVLATMATARERLRAVGRRLAPSLIPPQATRPSGGPSD